MGSQAVTDGGPGSQPPSSLDGDQVAALQAPRYLVQEPEPRIGEHDTGQPSEPAQPAGPGLANESGSEDDVVPDLPEYDNDPEDDGEGTKEEGRSEHQSEPISPAHPYGSHSAPVTPAKSSKKGWSFKRMFGSKRRKSGGEDIEEQDGSTMPAARSISAGDLSSPLTSPRKKQGSRLARLLGRKRQVRTNPHQ